MRESVKNTAKKKKKPNQPTKAFPGLNWIDISKTGLGNLFLLSFSGESDHLDTRSDLILADQWIKVYRKLQSLLENKWKTQLPSSIFSNIMANVFSLFQTVY